MKNVSQGRKRTGVCSLLVGVLLLLLGCDQQQLPYLEVVFGPEVLFTAQGGTSEVAVKTNSDNWSVVSDQPWCVVEKTASDKFVMTIQANTNREPQAEANITISAPNLEPYSIKVTRLAGSSMFSVVPDGDLAFEAQGGVMELAVTTNIESWRVKSNSSWCMVAKSSDNKKIIVTVAPNPSQSPRQTALISVLKEGDAVELNIRVDQLGAGPSILLTPSQDMTLPAEKATVTVEVVTNVRAWTVTSDQLWCRALMKETGNSFSIHVDQNRSFVDRGPATLTVKAEGAESKTIKVTQLAAVPSLSLSQSSDVRYRSGGGRTLVEVTTNVSDWKVSSDKPWCVVTKNSDNTFSVVAQKNEQPTAMSTATVTVTADGVVPVCFRVNQGAFLLHPITDENFTAILVKKYGFVTTLVEGRTMIDLHDTLNQEKFETTSFLWLNSASGASVTDQIHSLAGIENFTKLEWLQCDDNQIPSVDLSKNTTLQSLSLSRNLLTSLDVSPLTALTSLNCSLNDIKTIDVSNNTLLQSFACDAAHLTSVDVSMLKNLTHFSCYSNDIAVLNLQNNTKLYYLNCSSCDIVSLDLSYHPLLDRVLCSSGVLKNINLSNNPILTFLDVSGNDLTTIDLKGAGKLTTLLCSNNELTTLDLSVVPQLQVLQCKANELMALNISMLNSLYLFHPTDQYAHFTCGAQNKSIQLVLTLTAAQKIGWGRVSTNSDNTRVSLDVK